MDEQKFFANLHIIVVNPIKNVNLIEFGQTKKIKPQSKVNNVEEGT